MKVKSQSEVAQSCPTLSDPMDYSLPGSSVHGIFQARVLEWVDIAFSTVILEPKQKKKNHCFYFFPPIYNTIVNIWVIKTFFCVVHLCIHAIS